MRITQYVLRKNSGLDASSEEAQLTEYTLDAQKFRSKSLIVLNLLPAKRLEIYF
jgi:hypothetical protein